MSVEEDAIILALRAIEGRLARLEGVLCSDTETFHVQCGAEASVHHHHHHPDPHPHPPHVQCAAESGDEPPPHGQCAAEEGPERPEPHVQCEAETADS